MCVKFESFGYLVNQMEKLIENKQTDLKQKSDKCFTGVLKKLIFVEGYFKGIDLLQLRENSLGRVF